MYNIDPRIKILERCKAINIISDDEPMSTFYRNFDLMEAESITVTNLKDSVLTEKNSLTGRNVYQDENNEQLKESDAIIIINGKPENTYSKTSSIFIWLFGMELQECVILFTRDQMVFFAGKKKCDYFKGLSLIDMDNNIKVKFIVRESGESANKSLEEIVSLVHNSGKGNKLGYFSRDQNTSDFAKSVYEKLKNASFDFVDVSQSFSTIFAEKDSKEIEILKKASQITCNIYNQYVRSQLIEAIDLEKKLKHSKLADQTAEALKNKKYNMGLDEQYLEVCYDPIIQSGDKTVLKFNNTSSNDSLHYGTIVTAVGIRYKNYCANVIRTLMVMPTAEQESAYEYLHNLLDWAISKINIGLKLADFYQMIVSKVEHEKPKLSSKLIKSFGFITGIEFRDAQMLISPKSTDIVFTKNCAINLNIGFQSVENPSAKEKADKVFSIWLGDTIFLNANDKVDNWTIDSKRSLKSIRLVITEEQSDDESGEESDKNEPEILGRGHRRAIIEQKRRTEATGEDKRADRRRELFQAMQEQVKNRLTGFKPDAEVQQKQRSNIAYKGAGQMPKDDDVRRLHIFIDKKYESVIFPVFGLPTPFHISTIKNVSVSIEGQYNYLRINFHFPKAVLGAKDASSVHNSGVTHIKELTLRARNQRRPGETAPPSTNLSNAHRLINEVLKKFKTREAEERERANLVEQDDLVVSQMKGAFRLKDLYVRPNITTKRITGTLEAHSNGFRFVSQNGDQVDILYNNIKHAFYQPCDGEMIILLHFHLKNAIMYARKKQQDIQFYAEVGELTTDLGKAHSKMHDRDDLEAEQHEREMREEIKRAFKTFTEKAENLARKYHLEFESPFRELGFIGNPLRSTVRLMPTSSCLVSLSEFPPVVLTLADVEFAMFERMSLSIKSFDMIFVFKDYSKKVLTIGSIPAQSQDLIKEWLLSCDIFYAEGTKTLNWIKLMKTITDDLEGFLEQGGWDFVSPDDDDNAEADEQNSEVEDENYNPTGSESEGEGSDSDYSGSESGDDSEDWDAEEDSESGSLESDESEGLDWDELERRAIAEDKRKDMEGDPSPKKSKKRPPSPPSRHKSTKKSKK